MACGEPSPDVLREDLSKVFFGFVGATGDEHPRVLGIMEQDDVFTEVAKMMVT